MENKQETDHGNSLVPNKTKVISLNKLALLTASLLPEVCAVLNDLYFAITVSHKFISKRRNSLEGMPRTRGSGKSIVISKLLIIGTCVNFQHSPWAYAACVVGFAMKELLARLEPGNFGYTDSTTTPWLFTQYYKSCGRQDHV